MALNLSDTSNFVPNIRWMASTSTWQRSSENGTEVVNWSEAVFDLAEIETGWLSIAAGLAPEFRKDPDLKTACPKPTDDGEWKRGFRVMMYAEAIGGLREWTTNSKGALIGIDTLHDLYLTQKGENPGKVPVVKFDGAQPIKLGQGHTSVPQLTITKWIDKPTGMRDAVNGNGQVTSNAEFA